MHCSHCNKDVVPLIIELKATYQSSNKDIIENTHWLRQLLSQCYVVGTKEAYLTRFCLMGNWKSVFGKKEEKALPENRKPTLNAYKVMFTQEEIDRNWEWMKERRDLFLKLLDGGELLPKAVAVPPGQIWECGFCSFQEECGKE